MHFQKSAVNKPKYPQGSNAQEHKNVLVKKPKADLILIDSICST